MIGKMLGHSHAATTQPYAHLAADSVKEAVGKVGAVIAHTMQGGRGKNTIPVKHE
jgi:hypothetical protein